MKLYFTQCRIAREAQLLQQLNQLIHFKDTALAYTLSDLQAIQDGTLVPRLQEAYSNFVIHIKRDCPVSLSLSSFKYTYILLSIIIIIATV